MIYMENFQLLRTNILLGGQLAWDLILDNHGDDFVVSDFHLSPINIKTPRYSEENLLNYTHQDNLKTYYKKNESIFYDTNINPKLKHDWIVLGDKKEEIYEDSFEAGAKYADYQLYYKPIEILCPIWLEQLKADDKLILKINMYSAGNKSKKICTKAIDLTADDKFGKYFKSYVKYLGLNEGTDDVLDINLSTKKATITGISLDSGNIIKNDVSYIISNLLYRERPMMEFDSLLINLFANNRIITRQLFNFNLCIDVNDLLSGYLANMIYGGEFKFDVDVYINDKKLEVRDFYSNYEYIPKEDIEMKTLSNIGREKTTTPPNVLNYLLDYDYVNYITKNKYIQNIVHWSLNDNPDYLFNLYNGFGPYDNENYYSHKYGNAPDLLNPVYNSYLNNIGWCSAVKVPTFKSWLDFINLSDNSYYEKLKSYASDFHKNWINKIKYNKIEGLEWNEYKLMMFIVGKELTGYDEDGNPQLKEIWPEIKNNIVSGAINDYKEIIENELYYIRINESDAFMGLVVNEDYINNATFASISQILKEIELSETHPLTYLKKKLNSFKPVPLISIDKSLFVVNASSPSTSTTEIEYFKDDNASIEECYVLRYDGKIKPSFITKEDSFKKNFKYYKEVVQENELKNISFNKYVSSGFPPNYPSIKYCAINSKPVTYDKWDSSLIILIPEINVQLTSIKDKTGKLYPIKDVILTYLKELYNTDRPEFIYDFYEVESSYDYKEPNNINEYIYNIKLILK